MDDRPLILTLGLEAEAQARFDALRRQHFPPERNHIPAHVTLFHALPGGEAAAVADALAEACRTQPTFPVEVCGLRFLGRGVAYEMRSDPLSALRGGLARRWRHWLTPQDAQGFRPHLTVQNKAAPEDARALLAAMRAAFTPFTVRATGVRLWRYLGGPWDALGEYGFAP